jgi:hypothetical protein
MKADPAIVSNVPLANERLVGRDWARASAQADLPGPNGRRLTLTRPGGVGKTLLARKIHADLRSNLEAAMDGLRGARSPYNLAYARYLLGFVTQRQGDHAATLVALGRPERAARLLAAAAPIRESLAAPLPPPRH